MKNSVWLNASSASALAIMASACPAVAQVAGETTGENTAPQAEAPGEINATNASLPAETPPGDEEGIVVTGSRVATNGMRAPTPVTVLDSQQLRDSSPNIAEAVRQLPQLMNSNGPTTPVAATGGGPSSTTNSSLNLRDLGSQRTLVLVNGRRPTPAGITGVPDMGALPLQLVKRVDIVTGGASAAYGSDAVSGVVNFVLDTDYEGLMVESRAGLSTRGDALSYATELSGGTKFADGRGGVVFSAAYTKQDGLAGEKRSWGSKLWGAIPNPLAGQPGEPQLLLRENVHLGNASFGGLIVTPGPLRDIAFDAQGNPFAFQHGTDRTATTEVGGDGASYAPTLIAKSRRANGFAHAKYDISDSLKVFVEGTYAFTESSYPNLYPFDLGNTAYVIRQDNAYLPQSIRTVMQQNNIASFQLGKVDINQGRSIAYNKGYTFELTGGFEAKLFGDFKLDGYFTRGQVILHYGAQNNRRQANSRLGVDAVINPANGQIVCRSTLTSPTNGCVPFNPFGMQPLSDAQRDYLMGDTEVRSKTVQEVAALNLRGTPFSLWAGPVAMAVGVEYRHVTGLVDPDALARVSGWTSQNFGPGAGSFDVKEVFGEVLLPLLRDVPLAEAVDLNAAIRRTDYSTSGPVTTWKVGITDDLGGGLRLRATYSRDIRAPNIGELFGGQSRTVTNIRDPFLNNVNQVGVFTFTGANPNLVPERAKTLTVGGSYQPEWASGLALSVDYYKIDIKGAITTLAPQIVVDQCFAGLQFLCGLIERGPAAGGAVGELVSVTATGQNVSQVKVAGVDFEASYRTEAFGGNLNLRGIATYVDTNQIITPGAPVVERAGNESSPKWRGSLLATWTGGPWTLSVQERFIGPFNRLLPPTTIDAKRTPATFYTNLTVRYRIEAPWGTPEVFGSVNNLFDQGPRPGRTNGCSLGWCGAMAGGLFDPIGTYFTLGVRGRF